MTIGVGDTLGQYELLEKVGHGGMAVVYRGLDLSLKREVAVKVLHHHLAEHQEARDRFEREAHAVAKLRHDNILEIFAFSGKTAEESYIVTEFIDGSTLKEFISDHSLKYAEIGAMIALQVCGALSHAHSLGVLHRDVKPENIMIRRDGVVKLTDFGIAQMLDLRRMTVTGQLLGSPAYMSPEQVEGKPLDFRTDVFAVGIVLYQLVVGDLPFRGRNPHEILKRIAECRYTDPRQANPQVGNELGRIINKAMAREKEDRYADITEMLTALEHYLAHSGITDARGELSRFFAAPVSYEVALRERLVDHLGRRGRDHLGSNRVHALECFNRVLTIDPDNADVMAELNRVSQRRRRARVAAMVVAVVAVALAAFWVRQRLTRDDVRPLGAGLAADVPAIVDAGVVAIVAPGADAMRTVLITPVDAAPAVVPIDATKIAVRERADARARPPRRKPDAAVAIVAPVVMRRFLLTVYQRNSRYRIDNGSWSTMADNEMTIEVAPGPHGVEVDNACCQPVVQEISADSVTGGKLVFNLDWLPAKVTPQCQEDPDARVTVNNRIARLGRPSVVTIPKKDSFGTVSVTVEFSSTKLGTSKVTDTMTYKENKVVTCNFD